MPNRPEPVPRGARGGRALARPLAHLPRASRAALGVALALLVAGAAVAWVRHVPASGDVRAALAAGHYARAARWLDAPAAAGDPFAETALGNLYYLGLGVRPDARRAAELYYAAARVGHGPAQLNLGNLYAQGLGVPADALRAFGWYLQADAAGTPAAELYLRQISLDYTLSPLQKSTAAKRWERLDALVAEGL